MVEPDIILLDEPLSNLDARLRSELREEVRRIHRETGITTIYVAHDQKEALSLADRIAVLNSGKLEQVGTPRELYYSPRNRFVAEFLGETNLFPATILESDGSGSSLSSKLGELRSSTTADVGRTVLCSIRPESLQLGEAEINSFQATVIESLYFGELEVLRLLCDRLELKMLLLNPRASFFKQGQELQLHFSPQDLVLLKE